MADDPPADPSVDAPAAVHVLVADDQHDVELDPDRWAGFAARVVAALGGSGMEVSLSFVPAEEIATLKAEHLDGDGAPTDVLAFPMDEIGAAAAGDGPPPLLGDIVVCPAVAAAQAPTHAGSLDDELALLIVHAALHLAGHDHAEPTEQAAMQAEERRLLAALHGPLAADPWQSAHLEEAP